MATSFTSLPIIDLSPLKDSDPILTSPSPEVLALAQEVADAFATSGFAYLANLPLSFTHEDVFGLSKQFFSLPDEEKMKLGKRSFVKENENTYRGYFPTQPGKAVDNLKEGFEIGSGKVKKTHSSSRNTGPFDLYEPNIWPSKSSHFPAQSRRRLTQLYNELQTISSQLLSLLALSLNKPADYFANWLDDSLSTLRLLHYPPVPASKPHDDDNDDSSSIASGSASSIFSSTSSNTSALTTSSATDSSAYDFDTTTTKHPTHPSSSPTEVKLSCTPHTDSGILTLLHQDPTGGLEVLNSSNQWIPAPYIPHTLVVNIGDLMARVSGGRWVATMHRVRAPVQRANEMGEHGLGFGRFSVPFFFEPGDECLIEDVDGGNVNVRGEGVGGKVRYGDYVRGKMKGFVEYKQDSSEGEEDVLM